MATIDDKLTFRIESAFYYNRVQRGLHWLMAAAIMTAIIIGFIAAYLPSGQEPRKFLLEIHKSLGFTILTLLVLRVISRVAFGEPPFRQPLDRLTRAASHAAHAALYVLMLVMPITGYVYSASAGASLPWFGLFQWPRLLPVDHDRSAMGRLLHDRAAWLITGVILVHLAAVAFHHWMKRDEVLSRMTGR